MNRRPLLAALSGALMVSWIAPVAARAAPPAGGTIELQPKTGDGDYDPGMPAFVSAASDALAQKGFTIFADHGHAAYVGELIVSRGDVGTGSAKVAAGRSVATPGGVGPSVGAGITIPLSTGKSRLVVLRRTQLDLRIRKQGDPTIVWQAAAVTVRAADTVKGSDEAVAAALGEALLRSYPAEPSGVVGVP